MNRAHITVANALLSPHRHTHPVVAEARRAADWIRRTHTSIMLTAQVEHQAWREKFLILNTPAAPGAPQLRANDKRHLRAQLAKHQRRIEVLGLMWAQAQPKKRGHR